jgi:molecular chaperone GrpE
VADRANFDPAGHDADLAADALELDGDGEDLDAAMRDAVAAVEAVESRAAGEAVEPAGAGEPEGGEAEEPADLAELRRELDELRDRSVRTLADFDNFRKRAERERQELRRYALVEPMRDVVAVVDNLERAVEAEGSADDLKRGVELILRQVHDLLRRQGVKEVAAVGEPFDPAVHEAVARREEPGLAGPQVVRELQRGYVLHDRLLRPAIVEVAVPAEEAAEESPE